MIRVEHLYKNYGDSVKVLFDVNFTFEDGKPMLLSAAAAEVSQPSFAV